MPEEPSLRQLMTRLRERDADAAAAIVTRFASRLAALARSRLGRPLQAKVDAEDILQSVYKSFFLRQAEGQLEITNWASLWAVLAVITVRKCNHVVQRFHTAGRNVAAEVRLVPATGLQADGWKALAREPTPLEAAILTETLELLMHDLEAHERQILALHLQGCAVPEISSEVGCSERTVWRVLEHVRQLLERKHAEV